MLFAKYNKSEIVVMGKMTIKVVLIKGIPRDTNLVEITANKNQKYSQFTSELIILNEMKLLN